MRIFNPQLFHDNAFIMQFIPMILVLLMASFPFAFSQVSHSSFGKLFAVSLVLYYTRMNWKYGLGMAILFIIYYQVTETSVESFANQKKDNPKKDDKTVEDDGTNLPEHVEESFVSKPEPRKSGVITIDQFNDAKDAFVKEKCKNGVLMYKMMPVRNDMADHVYSEIKFTGDKCNPCSNTCDYNIIEAKMKVEESMIPRISRDYC